MTTVHPRRALAEAEAAAWLELHADWCRGLPAEVRDTSVIGTETTSGDGRSLPWYRMDGAFTGSPAPRTEASVDRSPRGHRSHPLQGWGESVASAPIADAPAAGEPMPLRGRALRAVGRQGTEQLRDVTVTLGQRVPASLRYDRRPEGDTRHQGVTQAFADLSGHADERPAAREATVLARLAAVELDAWCRERLTARQYQCLISEDLSDSTVRVVRHQARRILDAELPVHLRGLRRVLA